MWSACFFPSFIAWSIAFLVAFVGRLYSCLTPSVSLKASAVFCLLETPKSFILCSYLLVK